jgi:hypothetical protein
MLPDFLFDSLRLTSFFTVELTHILGLKSIPVMVAYPQLMQDNIDSGCNPTMLQHHEEKN